MYGEEVAVAGLGVAGGNAYGEPSSQRTATDNRRRTSHQSPDYFSSSIVRSVFALSLFILSGNPGIIEYCTTTKVRLTFALTSIKYQAGI